MGPTWVILCLDITVQFLGLKEERTRNGWTLGRIKKKPSGNTIFFLFFLKREGFFDERKEMRSNIVTEVNLISFLRPFSSRSRFLPRPDLKSHIFSFFFSISFRVLRFFSFFFRSFLSQMPLVWAKIIIPVVGELFGTFLFCDLSLRLFLFYSMSNEDSVALATISISVWIVELKVRNETLIREVEEESLIVRVVFMERGHLIRR